MQSMRAQVSMDLSLMWQFRESDQSAREIAAGTKLHRLKATA